MKACYSDNTGCIFNECYSLAIFGAVFCNRVSELVLIFACVGPLEGNISNVLNFSWKQWQDNILHQLTLIEHAMELEPFFTNFKLDHFVGGDEDYVKHVMQSFVDSAEILKNSEPLNASKVDRYQVPLCH
jgi:hypothetical protein